MDKQLVRLEEITKQIGELSRESFEIKHQLYQKRLNELIKYKNTFVKIEDSTERDWTVYMYIIDIKMESGGMGSPVFVGTAIYITDSGYQLYKNDEKIIYDIDDIVPITKFDWNNILQKIITEYTIKIPV